MEEEVGIYTDTFWWVTNINKPKQRLSWQYEVQFVVVCAEEPAVPAVVQKVFTLFSIPMNCTGEENCEKNN